MLVTGCETVYDLVSLSYADLEQMHYNHVEQNRRPQRRLVLTCYVNALKCLLEIPVYLTEYAPSPIPRFNLTDWSAMTSDKFNLIRTDPEFIALHRDGTLQ